MDEQGKLRCALCLGKYADSDEHIIPRSIGGGLKVPILCVSCNSSLGSGMDNRALRSGPIQYAAYVLKDRVPWLWRAVGPGISARAESKDIPLQVERETGDVEVKPHRDVRTGALKYPQSAIGEREVRKYLASEIRKRRSEEREDSIDVSGLLRDFRNAAPGETIEVPELGLAMVRDQVLGARLEFGPPLTYRYIARMAYLMLLLSGVTLGEPSLTDWRDYIRGGNEGLLQDRVMFLKRDAPTSEPAPKHLFVVRRPPGGPHLVDVCLFGCYAYRCLFRLNERAVHPFLAYRIDLASGTAAVSLSIDEFRAGRGVAVAAADPDRGWGARR